MSLARSKDQGGRISLILALVFPAIIAAAMALAYYGYQGAQDAVSSYQRVFSKAAEARAADVIDRVKIAMNDAVNPFFQEIEAALDDTTVSPLDKCTTATVPDIVDAFAVYPSDAPKNFLCVGPRHKLPNNESKRALNNQIQARGSQFGWANVPVGTLKYLHVATDAPVLFVVTKYRVSDDQSYLLVARLNTNVIRQRWLDDQLRKMGQDYRVSVVDERGLVLPGAVFGSSEPRPNERFLWDEAFGRDLYAWRLRVAPPPEEVRTIENRLKRQQVVQVLLVVLSTVIIAVGLTIVLLSVVVERRASQLKSDFIANVSHELKTPLSLIRMFGEMVATGRHKGEETAREYGSIITRESERLSHLIDNVLDFARLERGKASYNFAEGDLVSVLERALDVCRYRLEKDKMRLRTKVDKQLPLVRMDENALTLVILNLVDNAVKYAPEGGLVEISLERAPGGVVLSVRDYGSGIPREEQSRIFERFYRAQSVRDRNLRGSGIGLSLVRHIAEAHGGRVVVESPVADGAGGSVFRLFLPAPVVTTLESESEAHPPTGSVMMPPSPIPSPSSNPSPPPPLSPDLRSAKP